MPAGAVGAMAEVRVESLMSLLRSAEARRALASVAAVAGIALFFLHRKRSREGGGGGGSTRPPPLQLDDDVPEQLDDDVPETPPRGGRVDEIRREICAPETPLGTADIPLPPGSPVVSSPAHAEVFDEEYLRAQGLLGTPMALLQGLGAGDSQLLLNVLPAGLAEGAFEELLEECDWSEMGHKGGPVPRRIAIQGTVKGGAEPLYRHPADEQPALRSWSATVRRIKEAVEAALGDGASFNHALVQHYRDGHDHIGEHADKTLDVARGSFIINVSVGAARTLVLRGKKFNGPLAREAPNFRVSANNSPLFTADRRATQRVCLPHNSVFILGWETNKLYTHAIKPDKRSRDLKTPAEKAFGGERISLTFRSVATFRRRRDGTLYGQGAKDKGFPFVPKPGVLDGAGSESSFGSGLGTPGRNSPGLGQSWVHLSPSSLDDEEAEALDMLQAFSVENRRGDFAWDKNYGGGFNTVNFRILNDEEHRGRDLNRSRSPTPSRR